jgi:hypothetical protein
MNTSQEAIEEFIGFMKVNEENIKAGTWSHMEAFLRKLHGTAARIACLVHIHRYEKPEEHQLCVRDARAGISIATMLYYHAEYAFRPSGLCAFYDAMKIIERLRKYGIRKFSSKDFYSHFSNMNRDQINRALDLLTQHNIIAQVHTEEFTSVCIVHPGFDNSLNIL